MSLSHFFSRYCLLFTFNCFLCFFPSSSSYHLLHQREISIAADNAARAYKVEVPPEQRTALGIWKAMMSAEDKARKSYRSKSFEKYIAVANNINGDEFFHEVLFSSMLLLCF